MSDFSVILLQGGTEIETIEVEECDDEEEAVSKALEDYHNDIGQYPDGGEAFQAEVNGKRFTAYAYISVNYSVSEDQE